jgi:hypothetical protein
VVEIAAQLGHSATMTLNTYGHVIAELKGSRSVSAERQIKEARRRVNGPRKDPAKRRVETPSSRNPCKEPKPTPGFEPGTPSLRGRSRTCECLRLNGILALLGLKSQ